MEAKKKTKELQLFQSILQENLNALRTELNEEIKNMGDPLSVDLNKNDGLGDSDKALVYKDKDSKKEKSGPAKVVKSGNTDEGDPVEDVKLNQQPSKGGSDEKISTAVKVKAGAAKGGNDVTAGQAKANFESKTEGPKVATGEPFDEKAKDEMNQMDGEKADKEAPKTYVEAGAAKGGSDVTAGQPKSNWKEKAPKSDTEKRIADAIQLKESKEFKRSEMISFILAEAKKVSREMIYQSSVEKIQKDIESI